MFSNTHTSAPYEAMGTIKAKGIGETEHLLEAGM